MSSSIRRFSLYEINRATNDFSDPLGCGGFGVVFNGRIVENSRNVNIAVKRVGEKTWENTADFKKEIQVLSECRHPHVISLLGWCNEEAEMILVYELMARGSLYRCLYEDQSYVLSIQQRLEICIGVATGLDYLHSGAPLNVIQGNLSSDNILLDGNWVAKIGGFCFSRVRTMEKPSSQEVSFSVCGTPGYIAPECYNSIKKPSRKIDVYAFGVVILEVLCEKKAWENLAEMAIPLLKKGLLQEITSPYVRNNISQDCLQACASIVRSCLKNDTTKRPAMSQVVVDLKSAKDLQEQSYASSHSTKSLPLETINQSQIDSVDIISSRPYSLDEITRATNDYSHSLGHGAYGVVYAGSILERNQNINIAVKCMKEKTTQNAADFIKEIRMLSQCRHRHVVSLLGWCQEQGEMILIYELVPRGSLYRWLYEDKTYVLTMKQRLEICIGAAKGLDYLHCGTKYNIIHSDVKTENILLDGNWVAKIADFGLSRARPVDQPSSQQVSKTLSGKKFS